MATQVSSVQPKPTTLAPNIVPPQRLSVNTQEIAEEPAFTLPSGEPTGDTFSPTTQESPKAPPNTPVSGKTTTTKPLFGSHKTKTEGKQEKGGSGILGAVGGMARAVIQGPTYAILSNIITIPAGLIMAVTGVGIPAALATWFLGPLAAGAWGAYRGYHGHL